MCQEEVELWACEPDTQLLGSPGLEGAVCNLCFTLGKVLHALGKVSQITPNAAPTKVTVVGCKE